MQIQLRQTEIIAALKQYIMAQGISLAGKEVEIAFTAGRKEAGITADVSIEDLSGAVVLVSANPVPQPLPEVVAGPQDVAAADAVVIVQLEEAAAPAPAGKTSLFS